MVLKINQGVNVSKKLTIRDIAKLSQVGKSTVSRVLNNESGVNQKTREKVEAVIREHDFIPSKSARAMSTQSDQVVAIIVTRLSSASENIAVANMLPILYQQGYDPLIMESNFDSLLVEEHLKNLKQRQISGIIIFGFTGLEPSVLTPWADKLVLCARRQNNISSINYDDKGAIVLLMQELIRQGHQHISFIGVEDEDSTTGFDRHQAYLTTCDQHGIEACSIQTTLSYQSGFDKTPQILKSTTSAIICATDNLALGANKYLQTHQQSNIKVASVGNNPLLKFLYPETLCVDFGYQKGGSRAAELLINQIKTNSAHQQIVINSQLDIGNET